VPCDGLYNTKSESELIDVILKAKNDKLFYGELLNQSLTWFDEYCNPDKWKLRLKNLYQKCPSKHGVNILHKEKESVLIDDATALNGFIYQDRSFDYENKILRKLSHAWVKFWR